MEGRKKKTRQQVKWELTECCQILFQTLLWLNVMLNIPEMSFSITVRNLLNKVTKSPLEKPEKQNPFILSVIEWKSTSTTFSCGRLSKPQKSNGGDGWRLTIRMIGTNCNIKDKCRCSAAWRGCRKNHWSSSCQQMFSSLYLIVVKEMTLFSD